MKQILISIKPKWVAKILKGEKTLEIRKTAPKEWVDYFNGKTKKKPEPMVVYIYCTKNDYIGYLSNRYVGKVVAEFTLKKVEKFIQGLNDAEYEHLPNFALKDYDYYGLENLMEKACLNDEEINKYAPDLSFYAWHISDLEIFDEPKKLSDFCTYRKPSYVLERAPQSWCYVEESQ